MSTQINFSDLSEVQKDCYLKFIIENDIPLYNIDSSRQDFVAKITLPTETKVINEAYESCSDIKIQKMNQNPLPNEIIALENKGQNKQSKIYQKNDNKAAENKENNVSSKSLIKKNDQQQKPQTVEYPKIPTVSQINKNATQSCQKPDRKRSSSPYKIYSAQTAFNNNVNNVLTENISNINQRTLQGNIICNSTNSKVNDNNLLSNLKQPRQIVSKGNIFILETHSSSESNCSSAFEKDKDNNQIDSSEQSLFQQQGSTMDELRSFPLELPYVEQKTIKKLTTRQNSWQGERNHKEKTTKKNDSQKLKSKQSTIKFSETKSASTSQKKSELKQNLSSLNISPIKQMIPVSSSSFIKQELAEQAEKCPSKINELQTSFTESKEKQFLFSDFQKAREKSATKVREKSPIQKSLCSTQIMKLLKFKINNRITKIPIHLAKEIIEDAYNQKIISKSKKSMDEFVYDFFLKKYKQNSQIAEIHLINFISTLEFYQEQSLLSKQLISQINSYNESHLHLQLKSLHELQQYFKTKNLLSIKVNQKIMPMILKKICGDIPLTQFMEILKTVKQIEEFKHYDSISALDFIALIPQFVSTEELIEVTLPLAKNSPSTPQKENNNNQNNRKSSKILEQPFCMINESFGVQQCNKANSPLTQNSPIVRNTQSDEINSINQTPDEQNDKINTKLKGQIDGKESFNQDQNQSFQDCLLEVMDKLVYQFISMFEISDDFHFQKLKGLIFKKCKMLIFSLYSAEYTKWFECLAIKNPNSQQKMQAETILKLYEAYLKVHEVEGKDDKNLKSLCRLILKVPELCEAISKLLFCFIGQEER